MKHVVARDRDGESIAEVHPHLRSVIEGSFVSQDELRGFEGIVFSALPNGRSLEALEQVSAKAPKAKLIDLSGDLRLQDEATHGKHYAETAFKSTFRPKAVYGLAELNREQVRGATIVSNPGCLATATILALAPFADTDLSCVAVHAATGSSGAGKEPKATTHHPVRHANMFAYRPFKHQHEPEIQQALGIQQSLNFVPHSLPVSRGILVTAFVDAPSLTAQEVNARFGQLASTSPFVRFLGSGTVELENVVGSNFCDISVAANGHSFVIHAAIDNLIKGMAGQAIQNMNLMCGLPETTGLWMGGWRPV